MFKKVTIDPYSENIKKHAPIVHIDKRMDQMLLMALELDCLSMVHKHTKITRIYDILIESAYRNLRLLQNLLLNSFQDNGGDQSQPVSVPEIFHFLPEGVGHFITRVYDKKKSDTSLSKYRLFFIKLFIKMYAKKKLNVISVDDRRQLHKQFLLPMTQPIFRRSNRYIFKGDQVISGKLINPHEEVKPTTNGKLVYFARSNLFLSFLLFPESLLDKSSKFMQPQSYI